MHCPAFVSHCWVALLHTLKAFPPFPQADALNVVMHWPFWQQPLGQLEGPQEGAFG
jgi:hypothetical protein